MLSKLCALADRGTSIGTSARGGRFRLLDLMKLVLECDTNMSDAHLFSVLGHDEDPATFIASLPVTTLCHGMPDNV